MKQFNLTEWLQDKSRKVVTRDGREVEILKVNAKGNYPIIGVYPFSDTEDMESSWRIDGRKTENGENLFDLFFADEEEIKLPLTEQLEEYFKNTPKEQIEKDWKAIQDWYNQHYTDESNEEEELTEFESDLFTAFSDAWQQYLRGESVDVAKWAKEHSKDLLESARKELKCFTNMEYGRGYVDGVEGFQTACANAYNDGKQDALKSMPKWKRNKPNEKYIHNKGYYLTWEELEKLPKEE